MNRWKCIEPRRAPWCEQFDASRTEFKGWSSATKAECLTHCQSIISPGGPSESVSIQALSNILRSAPESQLGEQWVHVENSLKDLLLQLGKEGDIAAIDSIVSDPVLIEMIMHEPEMLARLVNSALTAASPDKRESVKVLLKVKDLLEGKSNMVVHHAASFVPTNKLSLMPRLLPRTIRRDPKQSLKFLNDVLSRKDWNVGALVDFVDEWGNWKLAT